jgi:hypothetical protein
VDRGVGMRAQSVLEAMTRKGALLHKEFNAGSAVYWLDYGRGRVIRVPKDVGQRVSEL